MNRNDILKKCGFTEKQIEYDGLLIFNIEDKDGKDLMDIIIKSKNSIIELKINIPDKDEDKIKCTYCCETEKIITEETTTDITSKEDLNKLVDIIQMNTKHLKGTFYPTKKIVKNTY